MRIVMNIFLKITTIFNLIDKLLVIQLCFYLINIHWVLLCIVLKLYQYFIFLHYYYNLLTMYENNFVIFMLKTLLILTYILLWFVTTDIMVVFEMQNFWMLEEISTKIQSYYFLYNIVLVQIYNNVTFLIT